MRRICFFLFSLFIYLYGWAQLPTTRSLFIAHTSDTHSCIEPISPNFADTAQADKGGYLRRVSLIKQLRREHPNDLLLFDCGDFSQGSVYYNLFKGEVEILLMNQMGYDACTIGNHEFDFGLENMARLFRMAEFPIVCCNYDFSGTPVEGLVKPYIILERAGVRVGILGVSPRMEGLVAQANYQGVEYTKPIKAAQPIVDHLRQKEQCDVVICLSHLGWLEGEEGDKGFIAGTHGIDVVLGGHSHTYFEHPQYILNSEGHEIVVNHMGKNARFVGTLELGIQ
ncbi:MAG: bifunctional metallophosphatase/5'-nucleotidase [Bacteroidaceae bacterium]|nr:bifunctional metallophosphatase/5'-nucleotidase [Bacteroidaceae bacterium]